MTVNPLLPIIEELADARSDASRAAWLLACPLSVLMTYEFTIANRLRGKNFLEGVDYLECELATIRSVRVSGTVVKENPLRDRMIEIAGAS